MLDRNSVGIPSKSTDHMVTCLMSKTGYDILNSSSENMTIMRQTGSEWGTVIETVFWSAL